MRIQLLYFTLVITLFFNACRDKNVATDQIVATNSWTAAFAEAAGAKNIIVLAPFEMEHPAEYELRPGDIPKIAKAKIIIYAGYENMVERLQSGLDIPENRLLQIETDYSYVTIEKSVMEIAKRLETEEIAKQNLQEIKQLFIDGKNDITSKSLHKRPTLVHFFQVQLVQELGIEPVGVFGPAPLEAAQIAEFAKSGATFVLDNIHNPVGQPLRQVLPNSGYKLLLNFPGLMQTHSLSDVIRFNIKQIVEK